MEGAVEARSLERSEVEMVVFELSVRKTLEGRQCGCRDLALALPINTRTVWAWHPGLLRNSGHSIYLSLISSEDCNASRSAAK